MKKYVVGFAFNEMKTVVLLIKKLKPEFQKGKLNGIGGKIEDGETPRMAMHRECFEETNLDLEWYYKGLMSGTNSLDDKKPFECHIFYAYDNKIFDFKQIEEEKLSLYSPFVVIRPDYEGEILANLSFVIPFGLCEDHSKFINIKY